MNRQKGLINNHTVSAFIWEYQEANLLKTLIIIGHFPSAQPFLWKWLSLARGWHIISMSKAEHLTSFWHRGLWQLENGPLWDCLIFGDLSVTSWAPMEHSKAWCSVASTCSASSRTRRFSTSSSNLRSRTWKQKRNRICKLKHFFAEPAHGLREACFCIMHRTSAEILIVIPNVVSRWLRLLSRSVSLRSGLL